MKKYPAHGVFDTSIATTDINFVQDLANLAFSGQMEEAMDYFHEIEFFTSKNFQDISINQTGFKEKMETHASSAYPGSLLLPRLLVEFKRAEAQTDKDPKITTALNQAILYCKNAAQFFAFLGIYEIPVWGLATSGAKGRIICAWCSNNNGVNVSDNKNMIMLIMN